jgi:hypothetical protein
MVAVEWQTVPHRHALWYAIIVGMVAIGKNDCNKGWRFCIQTDIKFVQCVNIANHVDVYLNESI